MSEALSRRPAIVQTMFDFAIREINALEGRIVTAEDDADSMLWEQARQVVEQLEAGLKQRELARRWINARTGDPYSERHVRIVRQLWTAYLNTQPRPRFREVYNEITNAHVSHNTGETEWYTPKVYADAARAVLGAIDLDPASNDIANRVIQAAQIFTLDDAALEQRWDGRVWMNPPYAQPLVTLFSEKLAASLQAGTVSAAIALVNNATETNWFRTLADVAAAICFPEGRVRFWHPSKEAAAPLQGQAVLYAGPHVLDFRERFGQFGAVWVKS